MEVLKKTDMNNFERSDLSGLGHNDWDVGAPPCPSLRSRLLKKIIHESHIHTSFGAPGF